MKRLTGLVIVAVVTTLILLFFTNPGLLDKVWIWMVGLAGYVLILFEKGFQSLAQLFEVKATVPPQPTQEVAPSSDENTRSKIEKIENRISLIEKQLMEAKKPGKSA